MSVHIREEVDELRKAKKTTIRLVRNNPEPATKVDRHLPGSTSMQNTASAMRDVCLIAAWY